MRLKIFFDKARITPLFTFFGQALEPLQDMII
jgi:hypothetical protein